MAMSYQMPLSDKQRKIGRNIYKVQKALLRALMEVKREKGLTQQSLAERLGVNRSVVNRRFTGRANLTLHSLIELAWALDKELRVDFVQPEAVRALQHTGQVSANEIWEEHKVDERVPTTPRKIKNEDVKRIWTAMQEAKADFSFIETMNDNLPDITAEEWQKAA